MTENHRGKDVLFTVQWLRFWAATIVVLSHVGDRVIEMQARYGHVRQALRFSGDFGVCVFFVISGFVMIYVAGGEFSQRGASARFLHNRVRRIVPLYWALTFVQALYILCAQALDPAEAWRLTVAAFFRSIFFVPYFNFEGKHKPVLEQGWTLDFEMMFYVLFAIALLLPRRIGLGLCVAALVMLSTMALVHPQSAVPGIWCNPIVLYFAAGMGLALLRERLARIGRIVALPYPLLASLLLLVPFGLRWNFAEAQMIAPVFAVGVVALATLCRDPDLSARARRTIAVMGNMSYSIYLVHGFALLVVGIVWRKLFHGDLLAIYAVLATVASLALGYLCYVWLEKPLTRLVQGRGPTVKAPVQGAPGRVSEAPS